MLEQRLQNKQPNWLQGVGIVLAIAVAVILGSNFFAALAPRIGTLSSLLFILYGVGIAWLLQFWFIMGFIYTATDDVLRVCRSYGKRERFMADVWLNTVQGYGKPEDVRKRFPGARVSRATRRQSEIEPFALAYSDGGKTAILVIQPDERMKAHLIQQIK